MKLLTLAIQLVAIASAACVALDVKPEPAGWALAASVLCMLPWLGEELYRPRPGGGK
jgi:hypothetical protein